MAPKRLLTNRSFSSLRDPSVAQLVERSAVDKISCLTLVVTKNDNKTAETERLLVRVWPGGLFISKHLIFSCATLVVLFLPDLLKKSVLWFESGPGDFSFLKYCA